MGGSFVQIKVDDASVRRALSTLSGRVGQLWPALKNIGEYMVRSTWERFDAQKDPGGTPWAPLKNTTLLRKRGSKILIETSRLRDSIVYKVSEREVAIGTNVVYAAIHQFGGKTKPTTIRAKSKKALFWPGAAHPVSSVRHPGSTIPARPFLGISEEDRQEIAAIFGDHLFGRSR